MPAEMWGLFSDVMFLTRHPGWSWRDVEEAPADLIESIRLFDEAIARKRED